MRGRIVLTGIVAAFLVAACSSSPPGTPAKGAARVAKAFALLEATKGNHATGQVQFSQEGDKVLVIATIHDLAPDSLHGFHLHANGDCSSGDGMSAGGHFNPDNQPHGAPDAPHHAGDMPQLKADANGVASATFVLRGVTVSAGAHSIVGKGLIVHQDPDDYTTQPTGNSGARIACGVVVLR